MKKSFKKLALNKKTILTLNQAADIRGGVAGSASGVQGCGGQTTQPCCGPSVTCPPKKKDFG